jgi:hypothetical protein
MLIYIAREEEQDGSNNILAVTDNLEDAQLACSWSRLELQSVEVWDLGTTPCYKGGKPVETWKRSHVWRKDAQT